MERVGMDILGRPGCYGLFQWPEAYAMPNKSATILPLRGDLMFG